MPTVQNSHVPSQTSHVPSQSDDISALRRQVCLLEGQLQTTTDDLVLWRTTALRWWSEIRSGADEAAGAVEAVEAERDAAKAGRGEAEAERDAAKAGKGAAEAELAAMRTTLSWRITAPIRAARMGIGRLAAR